MALIARLLLPLAGLALLGAAPEDRCASLKGLATAGVTIETAETIQEQFTAADGTHIDSAPACRVRGVARPVAGSHIVFELWLPRDGWNGRYYQLGNGGFAGNIHYSSLAAEVGRGNAAAVTDTGHSGDQFDARWAGGHPERVIDYGHRSIKATADAARALIARYYGRPPARRYFAGCSNGGRQALMAAARYPGDWDGIIAGAPAHRWTSQLADFAKIQHQLRAVPGGWVPPTLLPMIQRAALASCPQGLTIDGIVRDPRQCRFDPAKLLCKAPSWEACLTSAQVESLRVIMSAGFEPAAMVTEDWRQWITNPDPEAHSQFTFATQAFRHLLQDQPNWQLADHVPGRLVANEAARETLDVDPGALDEFRARGGKIISYFGWADAVIAPRHGADFYRDVIAHQGDLGRTLGFYRLFMVPGMTHCQGGPGSGAFGQSLPAPALRDDRRHDIRRALEAWVEQGIAPDSLIAVHYREDDPRRGVSVQATLLPHAPVD